MSDDGFVRSSFCSFGNCVEVKKLPTGDVAVRGQARDVVLYFTAGEWRDFLLSAKAGEFDNE